MSADPRGDDLDTTLLSYALGELEQPAREGFERRLAADADLRARLTSLNGTLVVLAQLPEEAWDAEDPPPAPSLDARSAHRDDTPSLLSAPGRRRRRRARPALGLAWGRPLPVALAASALLAIGIAAGLAIGGSPGASPAIVARADLTPIGSADPGARATLALESDRRTAQLTVDGLAPTDGHHVYELWLMDSTSDLIAVASFRVNRSGQAHVAMSLPTDPSHFRYLDVSVQPLDGAAAHSNLSVLRGTTP